MSAPAAVLVHVSADHSEWRSISAVVQSVNIEDNDALTDKATLVLDDSNEILSDIGFTGLEVRVALGWENPTWIFEGQIAESRNQTHGSGQLVTLTAYDFSYRMSREERTRDWHATESLKQILSSIVALPDYCIVADDARIAPEPNPTFSADHPLRQANLSDWHFILELAQRYNARAFVEFNADQSQFFFMPLERIASQEPSGALRYCRGTGELLDFQYQRVGAGATETSSAASVNPSTGVAVESLSAPAPPPAPIPPPRTADRESMTGGQRRAVDALAELAMEATIRDAPRTTRAAGTPSAPERTELSVAPDPTRKLGLTASGVAVGNPSIRAKNRVTVVGVAPWAEGDWYLRKVNHIFSREQLRQENRTTYRTTFQATR